MLEATCARVWGVLLQTYLLKGVGVLTKQASGNGGWALLAQVYKKTNLKDGVLLL